MTKESENPAAARIVEESWTLWRESFRMARLLLKEGEPLTWEEREQKEHYYAFVPVIAAQLHDQMLGGSHFIATTPEKDQLDRFDNAMQVVRAMKSANETAEKRTT